MAMIILKIKSGIGILEISEFTPLIKLMCGAGEIAKEENLQFANVSDLNNAIIITFFEWMIYKINCFNDSCLFEKLFYICVSIFKTLPCNFTAQKLQTPPKPAWL